MLLFSGFPDTPLSFGTRVPSFALQPRRNDPMSKENSALEVLEFSFFNTRRSKAALLNAFATH